jgi:hypothetical protein
MFILQTVIIVNNTYINQALFITLITILIWTYTLINRIIRNFIYIEKKDINL